MVRKYVFFLLFSYLCMLSCSVYENKNPYEGMRHSDEIAFVLSGEKCFSPDEKTPSNWLNAFIYSRDTVYWALYNSYLGDLNLFDVNDGAQIKTEKFPLAGKDCIVFNGENMYVQDYDSVTFYKINGKCIVDTIVPWKKMKLRIAPSRIDINNNVYEYGRSLYFITYTMGEYDDEKRNVCMEYDKGSGEVSYFMNYPPVYKKANWGGTSYRRVYTCSDSSNENIIFSFPVSHSLYIFNCKSKKITEVYAGSSYISQIRAFSNDKNDLLSSDESFRHFMTNFSYSSIIYDKYRKLYYRIAEIPYTNNRGDLFKKVGLVVLNEQFEIVGEKMFGKGHGTTLLIVPEGVLIPKIDEYPILDAPLSYYLYTVEK